MIITRTQIRETVVKEAIARAKRECAFLFVYEYEGLFAPMIWATLIDGEPIPDEARLLCTVNQDGHVDWKLDGLVARTPAELPIEEVQFNNVTITIALTDPTEAYTVLCQALARFEYTTDTFHTTGWDGESEPHSTTILFPQENVISGK